MIFTAFVGSALASLAADEPQEDFLHSAHLPTQVSWADIFVQTCIGIAPVRLVESTQLPVCRLFRCQEAKEYLGSFWLAERSKRAHSFADGKEKSQGGTSLSSHRAEAPAGLRPGDLHIRAMVCTGHGGHFCFSQHAHSQHRSVSQVLHKAQPGARARAQPRLELFYRLIMERLPCSNPHSISQPPPSSASGHFTSPLIRMTSRWDFRNLQELP